MTAGFERFTSNETTEYKTSSSSSQQLPQSQISRIQGFRDHDVQERYDGKHKGSLLSRGQLLVCHHVINDEVGTIAF